MEGIDGKGNPSMADGLKVADSTRTFPTLVDIHLGTQAPLNAYLNVANAALATSPSCAEDIPDIPIAPITFPFE